MSSKPTLTLYHHPHSRSAGVRVMLEELGVDHRIELVDLQAGEQRRPEFLALNPLGKLPTLVDGDTVVTEQVAVYLHLADRFPRRASRRRSATRRAARTCAGWSITRRASSRPWSTARRSTSRPNR